MSIMFCATVFTHMVARLAALRVQAMVDGHQSCLCNHAWHSTGRVLLSVGGATGNATDMDPRKGVVQYHTWCTPTPCTFPSVHC